MADVTEAMSELMRKTASEMDRDAGRLDRRGNYLKACDTLRLADLLREVAWKVEAWEAKGAAPVVGTGEAITQQADRGAYKHDG